MNNNKLYIGIAIVLSFLILGGIMIYSSLRASQSMNNNTNINSLITNQMSKTVQMGEDMQMDRSMSQDSMMQMDMTSMVTDEKTFLESMIPHHQEAVDSSKLVLETTKDPELKAFVSKVITDQSKEIEQMKSWYKSWYGTEYNPSNAKMMPMMGNMNQYSGTNRDKMYIKGMINHHLGAIEMAKKLLTLQSRDETKTLSNNIITTQQDEVTLLKNWLMTKFGDHLQM
jgi:uncharacterized protein (DUF305 family)